MELWRELVAPCAKTKWCYFVLRLDVSQTAGAEPRIHKWSKSLCLRKWRHQPLSRFLKKIWGRAQMIEYIAYGIKFITILFAVIRLYNLKVDIALWAIPVFMTGVELASPHPSSPWTHLLSSQASADDLVSALIGGSFLVFVVAFMCGALISKPEQS